MEKANFNNNGLERQWKARARGRGLQGVAKPSVQVIQFTGGACRGQTVAGGDTEGSGMFVGQALGRGRGGEKKQEVLESWPALVRSRGSIQPL